MFLGHYALAFAVKRAHPRTSLGVLFAAAQLPDLLWPVFLLLGWETIAPGDLGFTSVRFTHYPWSHSLAMVVVWGIVAAMAYMAVRRDDRLGALFVALLAVSHWVLDYVTHIPDLPLYPGGAARVGLGMWNSPRTTIVIEGLMWIAGIYIYVTATRANDRTGRYALWALILLLTLIYISTPGSSPPENLRVVGWAALIGLLVPFLAGWADMHRRLGNVANKPAENPAVNSAESGG
ncbi:MAG TPA: metal-dependent hydrolase [Gemmatimonadaceae bacterium]|jgi:membrane-bound metal-dependent hydrolase YbcI (DUF457 family)